MVLRIEYLLFVTLLLLLLSILGINPTSQSAISPKGEKEILFQDFSLFELKEQQIGAKLLAKETIKYKSHLDFREINLTDEAGNNIQARRGIYKEDIITMKEKISLRRSDGLTFTTENLNYDFKKREMTTFSPFSLELNESHIEGTNLEFNLYAKEISADKIRAKIYFAKEE